MKNAFAITSSVIFVLFMLFSVYTIYIGYKQQDLQRFGVMVLEKTLREQHAIVDNYWGVEFVSEFERGKEYNSASVMYLDKKMSRRDYNKSRIIGKTVAEKGKEFAGGFFEGLFEKNTKHSVDTGQ